MNPHDFSMEGRVCLVTGGSRALGASIARVLARRGADVAVNYNQSAGAAADLCQELRGLGSRAEPFHADVGDVGQASRLVSEVWERFGRLDVLVNNAGPYNDVPYLKLDAADFDHVMATNVRATYIVTREAGVRMKEQGSGCVVNIAAKCAYESGRAVYGLAKAGVVHLTRQLAIELAPEVRVNCIAPGLIADNEDMDPDLSGEVAKETPLGRLVSRAEIADVLYLLCGPAFGGVTGQTIVMDGGHGLVGAGLKPALSS